MSTATTSAAASNAGNASPAARPLVVGGHGQAR